MTVLALQTHLDWLSEQRGSDKRPIPTVLDALSASGLRALRYKKELESDVVVTANDISQEAVERISANAHQNELDLTVTCSDCNVLMRQTNFTAVDIDPYGSPGPFLAAAMQSVEHNGILMLTATDSLITCGRQVDECIRRYQALPVNNDFCHESSVRIVLKIAAEEANRQRCGFDVLCSFYMFHYLRVFLRIDKKHSRGIEMLNECTEYSVCAGCEWIQRGTTLAALHAEQILAQCKYCGGRMKRVGPVWSGPLCEKAFIERMRTRLQGRFAYLQQADRIGRFLEFQLIERDDLVFFFELPSLSRFFKVTTPPQAIFVNFLAQLGVTVYPTYFSQYGLKIDYTEYGKVLQLFGLWFRAERVAGRAKQENERIFAVEPVFLETVSDFEWILETQCGVNHENASKLTENGAECEGVVGTGRCVKIDKNVVDAFRAAEKIAMYLENPGKCWGPKKMK